MNFRRTQAMSVSDFMRGGHKKTPRITYKVVGTVVIVTIIGAFDGTIAEAANTTIDEAGRQVYYKLVNIGKWIIIFKGGIDVIKAITNGDFEAAKRSFLTYSLAYMLLLALPWGLDTIDEVFKDISG